MCFYQSAFESYSLPAVSILPCCNEQGFLDVVSKGLDVAC